MIYLIISLMLEVKVSWTKKEVYFYPININSGIRM